MGQKTNPIGFRLGVIKTWDANWFDSDNKNIAAKLSEDIKVRNYIKARKSKAGISRILVERTQKMMRIHISSAKPGLIIGRSGADIASLEEELHRLTNQDVKIYIDEIKHPE